MPEIRDNTARRRLELDVGGYIAFTEYRRVDDVLTLNHTEVPKQLSGRGIGSTLARGALDWARARRLRVVPRCPFIKNYIDKHAEYADLLA
jgi:predicted GNAT family acetyltransferase